MNRKHLIAALALLAEFLQADMDMVAQDEEILPDHVRRHMPDATDDDIAAVEDILNRLIEYAKLLSRSELSEIMHPKVVEESLKIRRATGKQRCSNCIWLYDSEDGYSCEVGAKQQPIYSDLEYPYEDIGEDAADYANLWVCDQWLTD